MKFSAMMLMLLPAVASGAIVNLRLSVDGITGHYQAFGTQSWFPENNSFFGDVSDSGFDFVVRYDTATPYFNQSGSLGTQFAASIISGTIGTRNVSNIANLSGIISIQSVAGSQPRQVVLFTAREEPFGTLQNGYNWNEAIFQFTDRSSSLSTTVLPDGTALLAATELTGASVRSSKNGGTGLATRELGSGTGDSFAAVQVPEPAVLLLVFSTLPCFLLRRSR